MTDPVDFLEFLQKFWIAEIKTHDFGKLRAVACFVFYDLAPDFDPAE